MVKEIGRVLKKNGRIVMTLPGKAAQPVLKYLSYRFKTVNADEIRDHENTIIEPSLKYYFLKQA